MYKKILDEELLKLKHGNYEFDDTCLTQLKLRKITNYDVISALTSDYLRIIYYKETYTYDNSYFPELLVDNGNMRIVILKIDECKYSIVSAYFPAETEKTRFVV